MLAIPRGYVLSATPPEVPADHAIRNLHGLYLTSGPLMPVHPLVDRTGAEVGWLLGWPVAPDARIVSGAYAIDPADPETAFYEFGGTWLAIMSVTRAVYLDPIGSLGLVFAPELQRAAPTSAWVPEAPLDEPLVAALDIPAQDRNWYPLDLTPRVGVHRLIPNHMLDLSTWTQRRHWPAARLPDSGPAEAVRVIGDLTERSMRAYADTQPMMGLTAGRDSRTLLACARPVAGQIEFVTREWPDPQVKIDVEVATRLARKFSLKHAVLSDVPALQTHLDEWQALVDRTVAGQTWRNVSGARTSATRLSLKGFVGEVARAFWWRKADTDETWITPLELLARTKLPAAAQPVNAVDRWMSSIPDVGMHQLLDLFYLEARLGSWAAAAAAGHACGAIPVVPMNHRAIVAQMLGLPPEYKRSHRLAEDVIRDRWPELLRWPFNQPVGLEALVRRVQRVARRIIPPPRPT
jgi:hypothetical protein